MILAGSLARSRARCQLPFRPKGPRLTAEGGANRRDGPDVVSCPLPCHQGPSISEAPRFMDPVSGSEAESTARDRSTTEGTIPEMLPDRRDFYPEASLCSVAFLCAVLGAEGMDTEILDASRTISCMGGLIRHESGHFHNSKQPPLLSYSDLRPTGPQKSILT